MGSEGRDAVSADVSQYYGDHTESNMIVAIIIFFVLTKMNSELKIYIVKL